MAFAFFDDSVKRVRDRKPGVDPKIRADAGFWSAKMASTLWNAEFTPVETVEPVFLEPGDDDADYDEGIDIATLPGALLGMDPRLKVIVIRRRVHDKKAPPSCKKIEQEPDGRYHAVVTSPDWDAVDCWRFYNDRGDAERVFKPGKQALALRHLVSQVFRVNEVAFILRLIAYKVDIRFQQAAERAAIAENRPVLHMGRNAHQPRLLGLAGRLLRVHDKWLLRLPSRRTGRRGR